MTTRQTSEFTSRYGGKEKAGYAVEHQDEEINHTQNADPGIALKPGESNVVDMTLAIPEWMTAVDLPCTLVLTQGLGGPDQVWTSRCPHDIPVRTSDGE